MVIYKTSNATYYIGQFFIFLGVIHVEFFSLVNIILKREVVKEILQFRISSKIRNELKAILNDETHRNSILKEYEEINVSLMLPGISDRVGLSIVLSLKNKN